MSPSVALPRIHWIASASSGPGLDNAPERALIPVAPGTCAGPAPDGRKRTDPCTVLRGGRTGNGGPQSGAALDVPAAAADHCAEKLCRPRGQPSRIPDPDQDGGYPT